MREKSRMSDSSSRRLPKVPSNPALGELAEETLKLIQPTRTGGREMQMITRPPRKPPLYFGHLVRAIVVHHQVDAEILRDRLLHPVQEAQELLMLPRCKLAITLPVATSRAANKEVVPLRR